MKTIFYKVCFFMGYYTAAVNNNISEGEVLPTILKDSSSCNSFSSGDYVDLVQCDGLNEENFYFKNAVTDTKESVFFILLSRVFKDFVRNLDKTLCVINKIYIIQELGDEQLIPEFFQHIYRLAILQRQYLITESLVDTEGDLTSVSETTKNDAVFRLHYFMLINNVNPEEIDDLDFIGLRKLFIEKYPSCKTVEKTELQNKVTQALINTKKIIKKTGMQIKELLPFLSIVNELAGLSTYIFPLLVGIPNNLLYNFFTIPETQFIGPFQAFLYTIDVFFYMFEHDLFLVSNLDAVKTNAINNSNIKGVVKFIGVLFKIQKNYKKNNNSLPYITLQNYIKEAENVANLPENAQIILHNYDILIRKFTIIENDFLGIEEIELVIKQYFNSNVSLFYSNHATKKAASV